LTSLRLPNFIRNIIEEDNASGKWGGTGGHPLSPEPNGYLHIGHAKSICLNFGLAAEFGGRCHMRFDDTNPVKEDVEYTEAILNDVKWLGFSWGEHLHYASDYFDQLHDFAVELIKKGLAFVDDSSRRRNPGCAAPSPNRAGTAPIGNAVWRRTWTFSPA
jgi:glutaminyl-tRNA synthetase